MHWIIFILIVYAWFIFTKSSSHETRVSFNAPGRFRMNVQSPQASLELPPSVTTTANNIFPSPFIANIYNGLGIYPHLPSTFQAYLPYFQLQPFIVVALSNKETVALQSALSNQQIIIPQLSQTYFCGWGICPNSQSQSLHQNNIGSNSIEPSLNSKTMSNPQQSLQNNTIDFLLSNQPDSQIKLNQNGNINLESNKNKWAQQNSTKISQNPQFNPQLNLSSSSVSSLNQNNQQFSNQQSLQINTHKFLLPNQPDSQILLNQNANINSESNKNEREPQPWTQQNYNSPTKIQQNPQLNSQLNFPSISVSSLNQNYQQSSNQQSTNNLLHPNHQPVTYSNSQMNQQNLTTQVSQKPQLNPQSNHLPNLPSISQQLSNQINQQFSQSNPIHEVINLSQHNSQTKDVISQPEKNDSFSNLEQTSNFQTNQHPWESSYQYHSSPNQQASNPNSQNFLPPRPQANSQPNTLSSSLSNLEQTSNFQTNQHPWGHSYQYNSPSNQQISHSKSQNHLPPSPQTNPQPTTPSSSLSKLEQTSNFQPNQYLWGSISSHHNSPSNQQTSNSNSQNYLPLSPQENFQTITPSSSLPDSEQTSNFQSNQHLWGSSSQNNSPSNQQTSNSNSQKYLPLSPQENSQANTPSGSLPNSEQTSNFHTNQHAWGSIFQYPSSNQQTSNSNSHNYLLLRPQNNSQPNTSSFSFANLDPTSNFQSNQHLWGFSSYNNSPINQQTSNSNSQKYLPH